jgi:hypothetical protein
MLSRPRPFNRNRLPWVKSMTLCIAAVCRSEDDKPVIVLCSDHKIGNWAAQAEIGFKFSWATRNWPSLIAGDVARTDELVATFQKNLRELRSVEELDKFNVFDAMKTCGYVFREKLVDELVRKKLSVSYEYLRQNKSKFPSATVYETYTQIGQIDSEAEMIAAGFIEGRAYLFVVERDCTVHNRKQFAAIGTGAQIAEPALFQRKQSDFHSIPLTIYNVYEAKKLGEIADGVGRKTSMLISSPRDNPGEDIDIKRVNDEGMAYLEQKYAEFGHKVVAGVEFKQEFMEDLGA